MISICGTAGFGFIEDPFCFHKGTIPVCRDRLILEVKFASKNYEAATKIGAALDWRRYLPARSGNASAAGLY